MALVVAGLSRLCQVGTTTTTTTTSRECSIYFESFPNSMDSTMTLNVFAAWLWLWLGDLDLIFVKIDLAWLHIIETISTPTPTDNKVHRSRRAQWSKCSCILRRSKLMYGVDLPTFVLSKRILGPLITKLQPASTPCPPDPRSGQQQHHGSKDSETACYWKDPNWTGGNREMRRPTWTTSQIMKNPFCKLAACIVGFSHCIRLTWCCPMRLDSRYSTESNCWRTQCRWCFLFMIRQCMIVLLYMHIIQYVHTLEQLFARNEIIKAMAWHKLSPLPICCNFRCLSCQSQSL